MKSAYEIEAIDKGVWKARAQSNIYLLDLPEGKIVIDTGARAERKSLEFFLGKFSDLNEVRIVIFTHLHYDHCGNFDLFPNARLYASRQEIDDFNKSPEDTVLDADIAQKLKKARLFPVEELKIPGIEIIPVPGHTRGSICIWLPRQKILFSGDTIFASGLGRTDLPTSDKDAMRNSVNKLVQYNHRILCSGHD